MLGRCCSGDLVNVAHGPRAKSVEKVQVGSTPTLQLELRRWPHFRNSIDTLTFLKAFPLALSYLTRLGFSDILKLHVARRIPSSPPENIRNHA